MQKITMGLIIGLICSLIFITNQASAEVQQGDVDVELVVPKIIQLDIITPGIKVVPGPEDYARNLDKNDYEGGSNVEAGRGFADRSSAIEINIFTNAANGAVVYAHGIQPPGPTGVLRLEDTYLTVQTEKTYILQNNLEGAETKFKTSSSIKAYWLRLHNEAQQIFKVSESTKDPRLIVFKIGIGNLSRYTSGSYRNTITFSLMPTVI